MLLILVECHFSFAKHEKSHVLRVSLVFSINFDVLQNHQKCVICMVLGSNLISTMCNNNCVLSWFQDSKTLILFKIMNFTSQSCPTCLSREGYTRNQQKIMNLHKMLCLLFETKNMYHQWYLPFMIISEPQNSLFVQNRAFLVPQNLPDFGPVGSFRSLRFGTHFGSGNV